MIASDRRRHERRKEIIIVQYTVTAREHEIFNGVVADISESGFCLLTTHPLTIDDTLTVKREAQKHELMGTATVRWVDDSVRHYSRIGLEFLAPNPQAAV